MKRVSEEMLLAFLEGTLDETDRETVLAALEADPELSAEMSRVAAGLEAMGGLGEAADDPVPAPPGSTNVTGPARRISPWWAVAASVATLLVSVPVTWSAARAGLDAAVGPVEAGGAVTTAAAIPAGAPESPAPSYMLVLHGRWPDAGQVPGPEGQARAREYWGWTSALAEEGVLVAAGDLRWEPGERLGPLGVSMNVPGASVEDPDYLVGILALRVDSYEEALAIARDCPHLRYGGSVSIRRVGAGFVTVDGMGDWTD